MKKIKLNSYLELEKYPQIITNINRLINKKIDIDYIDEYRKYLLTSVEEHMLNSNNEYIISLDEIRDTSILYTFDGRIDNLISELIEADLLILNHDGTYSFNEDIYDSTLVENEKHNIELDTKYPLVYIKSPWTLIESENAYSLEGYSDILQENTEVASVYKLDDEDDEFRKLDIEELVHVPNYFEILKKSLGYITDINLKNKVENLLNLILNFELECTPISNYEEYDSFLKNKTDNNLEILDVSEWMELYGAFDIVNKCDTLVSMHANDIHMDEIFGCMTLIMHYVKLEHLTLDVANKLPKDNDLYIEISELFGESSIQEWGASLDE